MEVAVIRYTDNVISGPVAAAQQQVNLVLCFGARDQMEGNLYELLRNSFPAAEIILCSSAGEICNTEVSEGSVVVTAISFKSTKVATNSVAIDAFSSSAEAGEELLRPFLVNEPPKHVIVFSDGTLVNGSELVKGLQAAAGGRFGITGGLAGDGSSFRQTVVGLNGQARTGQVVAVALYGADIHIRFGVKGGWTAFGPMQLVTKSKGNILYEVGGRKALDLYKEVLGPKASGLPEAALLFPLSVHLPGTRKPLVRTILSIDEAAGTMTFAGDIPEGVVVRFMQANLEKITDAASLAAVDTRPFERKHDFALLVSCVGRKLVLGSEAKREVMAIDAIFDNQTPISGFYSYGEISPVSSDKSCQLHNQTMTITTFFED